MNQNNLTYNSTLPIKITDLQKLIKTNCEKLYASNPKNTNLLKIKKIVHVDILQNNRKTIHHFNSFE